jgi:hypothetical protein
MFADLIFNMAHIVSRGLNVAATIFLSAILAIRPIGMDGARARTKNPENSAREEIARTQTKCRWLASKAILVTQS